MQNLFVPYEQALELKQLGFDKDCFGYYENDVLILCYDSKQDYELLLNCTAPLYSQAFKFFREKYKFHAEIRSYTAKYFTIIIQELKDIVRYLEYGGIDLKFNTYEEAELECLKKLIEIVKNGR